MRRFFIQLMSLHLTDSEYLHIRKKKGLRLLLGEFGCLPNCGVANRNAWLSDVVALCKENGISYSYWEFNHSYGFADKDGNVTAPDIVSILTAD